MRTPENLARFAAIKREADARRRAIADQDWEQKPAAADPGSQQQHQQPGPERGHGPGPGQQT
ncbi:hypothetical protein [Streptomyces sp. NL15-2K]|uniref:hypothetical protein n=1 Tax=Streptomyces sp. NL15-2K TaxID=376149 RepID=UPI000FFA4280|nr:MULTISPECIES: hypothetical protein [Actinomycetes]WKX06041.1 hypothetical protein Q4V64_00425 [Kutzneria buriramensis]GCB52690.1 hypothetical protein SNL152K_10047 [Streptomyces sp. NL15-2K]